MIWKEGRLKTPSVEVHQRRTKSRASRIRDASVRLSKTA
jgi:hypothetical protein